MPEASPKDLPDLRRSRRAVTPDRSVVGARVKAHRLAKNLTVSQLAAMLRRHPSTIRRLERGATMEPKLLASIAETLSVSVDELLAARPEPRIRTRAPDDEVPLVAARLLATGRLGTVTERELKLLVKASRDPDYAGDLDLLELYFRFRRACARMHDLKYKRRFDAVFERIRSSLLDLS